ncbi:MAG TPA: hypothetical protein VGY66_05545 [Gemmataceae bacterium]|jgi:hypothetical protein|nr:hypothetical protein [Gemmataceae bacterium]
MSLTEKSAYVEPGLTAFRRADRIARLQRFFTWIAPCAVLGWIGFGLLWPRPANIRYSPGDVAAAHALWNDRCDVCHANASPLDGGNWLNRISGSTHVGDAQCRRCHAGPEHHAAQKAEDVAACTACHVEHRGEEASLRRIADKQCTRCHAALQGHSARPIDPKVNSITGFDKNLHPPFCPADTGRLEFNHKRHMTRGIPRSAGGAVFLVGEIPEERRAQYGLGKADPNTSVQLRCEACHQLDVGSTELADSARARLPGHAVRPGRPSGAYMLPITYEAHCQACHALSVGQKDSVFFRVPHRIPPAEIRVLLEGHHAPQYLKTRLQLEGKASERPLPGRSPGAAGQLQYLDEAIKNPVARAEQELYETRKGCALCHSLEPDAGETKTAGLSALRKVVPTRLQNIWLEKASFDHARHRLLECRSCHPDARASEKRGDVLLPAIDTCFACHASTRRSSARSDCVQCHRYHNGDASAEGKGTARRGPDQPLSLEDFRNGRKSGGP